MMVDEPGVFYCFRVGWSMEKQERIYRGSCAMGQMCVDSVITPLFGKVLAFE